MRALCSGVIMVLMIVSLGPAVFAQSDIGLYGIGGKLGYVMPEGDTENTISFGIVSDLGTITPDIHLAAAIDYWSKSYDVGYWDWSFREIIIGATAKYFFPVEGDFKPYGGGGLGLSLWKTESDYTGPADPYTQYYDTSHSETDFGFHFLGGLEKELSPTLTGFAEAKYHINGADFFGFYAGVIYRLGK